MSIYSVNDTFSLHGYSFLFNTEADDDGTTPWEREDGHGPVSEWVIRDKRAGERVLCLDRNLKRYYDFAGAMKIAKRDGWGLSPDALEQLTKTLGRDPNKNEIAAAAVESDFERLRQWCNYQWGYVGVIVTLLDKDGKPLTQPYEHALWGIESDCKEYQAEVAHELAEECLREKGLMPDDEALEQFTGGAK